MIALNDKELEQIRLDSEQFIPPGIGDTQRMVAEIIQLKAECEESDAVVQTLAKILAGVAVALKGEELPLHRHGYHDLVELVYVLKLENDLRKGENDLLRTTLTECSDSLHSEMLGKFGGQMPDDMHPVTRREYDRDMAEVAGYRAVLEKGSGQ